MQRLVGELFLFMDLCGSPAVAAAFLAGTANRGAAVIAYIISMHAPKYRFGILQPLCYYVRKLLV